jgi:hypothetical protein
MKDKSYFTNTLHEIDSEGRGSFKDVYHEYEHKEYLRHYFAGLAMQGLLANPSPNIIGMNIDSLTDLSIDLSISLIKQLENRKP